MDCCGIKKRQRLDSMSQLFCEEVYEDICNDTEEDFNQNRQSEAKNGASSNGFTFVRIPTASSSSSSASLTSTQQQPRQKRRINEDGACVQEEIICEDDETRMKWEDKEKPSAEKNNINYNNNILFSSRCCVPSANGDAGTKTAAATASSSSSSNNDCWKTALEARHSKSEFTIYQPNFQPSSNSSSCKRGKYEEEENKLEVLKRYLDRQQEQAQRNNNTAAVPGYPTLIQNWGNDIRRMHVEFIVQLGVDFGCANETVGLAVSYFDKFLSKVPVQVVKLQALATACLFVAYKLDGNYDRSFSLQRYARAAECDASILLQYETKILNFFGWSMLHVTPHGVLRHLASMCVGPFDDERVRQGVLRRAEFVIDIASCDAVAGVCYSPGTLAVSAMAVAATLEGLREEIEPVIRAVYPLLKSNDNISECFDVIVAVYKGALSDLTTSPPTRTNSPQKQIQQQIQQHSNIFD